MDKGKTILYKFIAAGLFFMIALNAAAQINGFTIKGIVRDSGKAVVLEGATISLLRLPDSAMLTQTRSGKQGFVLRVNPGNYLLTVSFIGYKIFFYHLQTGGRETVIELPAFTLQPDDNTLQEVVVRSMVPVIARGDTLAFNAEAFKTRPNASVEDLLRKLPGVEVDEKGQVTVNGQRVDKFYIDGKEIPVSDARSLTQNLTADMLSSVETYDRQSNDSRFSGIKDKDPAKAINLKVKKIYQRSLTGRAFAAYGDAGHYAGGANSFFLMPDTKVQFTVNRNNSNDVLGLGGIRKSYNPWGIVASTNLSLQGNATFSKVLSGMGSYNFSQSGTYSRNNGDRQTFLIDSTLLSHTGSVSQNNNRSQQFNFELMWRPDSMNEVTIRPQFRLNHAAIQSVDSQQVMVNKSAQQYTATRANTNNKSVTDNSDVGTEINFRHRFQRKGETMGARFQLSGQSATTERKFFSHSLLFDGSGDLAGSTTLDQQSVAATPGRTLNAGINYTYPIGRNLVMDASYDYSNNRQHNDKRTYNYNSISGQYDLPDSLTTNQFRTSLVTQRIGVGVNSNKKGFNYQFGIALQHSDQQNINFKGPGLNFMQKQFNWFPRAMLNYAISPRQQFSMNYSGFTIQPSIYQLQPLPDFSNPLLIRKGNPDLGPQFDHNMVVSYQHFSKDRLQSLLFNISGYFSQNKLTQSSRTLAGGVQEIQFVNVAGTRSANMGINYNFGFNKSKKGNIRVGANLRYSHFPGIVNGAANTRETVGIEPQLGFNYSPLDKLLLESTAGLVFNQTSYSFSGVLLRQMNQRYALGISWELPAGFFTVTDYSLVVTGAQGSLPAQSVGIWNANVSKRLFRKKTVELRLSAFDLLKGNKGYFQTNGENYVASRTNLVLTRSFFFSFIYYFKAALNK